MMTTANDLATHITALNAKTAAWVAEAPQTRWASGLCEDLAHWHEYGIHTADQLDHYLLVSDVFEMTRSVHNYKPHWGSLMSASNADLILELANLRADATRQEEEEKRATAREQSFIRLECQNTGFSLAELLPTL